MRNPSRSVLHFAPRGAGHLPSARGTKKDELDALIADYLAEADRLHAIPMSRSPFERYLEAMS